MVIELRRGDAEIKQDAAYSATRSTCGDDLRKMRKGALHELQPRFVVKSLLASSNRSRVAIKREHAAGRAHRVQQSRRVTTPTERAIDIKSACGRGQNLQHLIDKHRLVLIHRSQPPQPITLSPRVQPLAETALRTLLQRPCCRGR